MCSKFKFDREVFLIGVAPRIIVIRQLSQLFALVQLARHLVIYLRGLLALSGGFEVEGSRFGGLDLQF